MITLTINKNSNINTAKKTWREKKLNLEGIQIHDH